jgi:glycosyltransferase involved in cell wall biosynthesis
MGRLDQKNRQVSIIVTTYKRNQFLLELVLSIQAQTYVKFELIIIDDDPSNSIGADLNKLIQLDCRIKYFRNETNLGPQKSRKKGASLSKYGYLCFVDDDDIWYPDKLASQITSKAYDFSICGAEIIDEKSNIIRHWGVETVSELKIDILDENFIPSPGVMISRELYANIGGHDVRFPSCQDWDLWIRAIYSCKNTQVINKCLVGYRKHHGATIGKSANSHRGYVLLSKKHMLKVLLTFKPKLIAKHLKRALGYVRID